MAATVSLAEASFPQNLLVNASKILASAEICLCRNKEYIFVRENISHEFLKSDNSILKYA